MRSFGLAQALHRDKHKPVLTERDIRQGCALQQRGVMYKHHASLGQRDSKHAGGAFGDDDDDDDVAAPAGGGLLGAPQRGGETNNGAPARLGTAPKPCSSLERLALKKDARVVLKRLVSFEQHRGVVFSTWGFADDAASASVALLYGPRGGGKRTVAAALARDLQSSLYRVEARDVLSDAREPGEAVKRLKAVLDDARLTDSTLLVDGFEHAFAANAAEDPSGLTEVAPRATQGCFHSHLLSSRVFRSQIT